MNKLWATFTKIRRKQIYLVNITTSFEIMYENVFYYLFHTPHVILLFSFVYECIKRAQCDNNSKSEIIIYWSSWKTKATWYHYTGIRVFYSLGTIIIQLKIDKKFLYNCTSTRCMTPLSALLILSHKGNSKATKGMRYYSINL